MAIDPTSRVPKLAVEHIESQIVDAGNDVLIPAAWTAIVTELDGIPGALTARVAYDPSLGRAVAVWVRIGRSGVGDEVTTTLLRDVRVQGVVQWSVGSIVHIARGGATALSYSAYLQQLREQGERTDEQTLREASTLYRVGVVMNYGPLKPVSEQLGVSVSTATRLMSRARIAGFVDEATGRDVALALREQQIREGFTSGPHQSPASPSGPSLGL